MGMLRGRLKSVVVERFGQSDRSSKLRDGAHAPWEVGWGEGAGGDGDT